MKFKIREAEKKDMPSVLALIKELAVFEKEPNAVEVTVETLLQAGFNDPVQFTCFVAETNQQIVGMALCYFRFSTWIGRAVHLEDLIVTNAMRGQGVGEALYAKVLQFATDHDVKRVQWEVIAWNEGAIKFYERTGAKVLRDWHVVQMDEKGMGTYVSKNQ